MSLANECYRVQCDNNNREMIENPPNQDWLRLALRGPHLSLRQRSRGPQLKAGLVPLLSLELSEPDTMITWQPPLPWTPVILASARRPGQSSSYLVANLPSLVKHGLSVQCHSGYQSSYLLNHIFVTYCLKLGPNNTNKLCEIPVYFRR